MNKMIIWITYLLLVTVLLTGCRLIPANTEDFEVGQDAYVYSLEVQQIDRDSGRVELIVTGELADGCTSLHEIEVEQVGKEFILTVFTRRPTGDVNCTMALVPFTETVELDVEDPQPGTFQVIAQNIQTEFTLNGEEGYEIGQDAYVYTLEVQPINRELGYVEVIVTGDLADGCTSLHEIEVEQKGQEFNLTVFTRRPTGDVACTMALVPFEETVELPVDGLEAGTYQILSQNVKTEFTIEGAE